MKKILVLMADGFEEIELCAPIDILRRLGVEVCLATLGETLLAKGANGVTIQADALLTELDSTSFDGVVLPGGLPGAFTLRDSEAVRALVAQMNEAGKLVAAICAAPTALEAAGVLKGRTVCCYPAEAIIEQLKSVAAVSDLPSFTDGNIVTGRGPGAALEFGFALGCYLGLSAEVADLRQGMCVGC